MLVLVFSIRAIPIPYMQAHGYTICLHQSYLSRRRSGMEDTVVKSRARTIGARRLRYRAVTLLCPKTENIMEQM